MITPLLTGLLAGLVLGYALARGQAAGAALVAHWTCRRARPADPTCPAYWDAYDMPAVYGQPRPWLTQADIDRGGVK